jgi:hypothetical protein
VQTQIDSKTAKSTLTTTGDIYYASAANTPARLGIGTASQVLQVNSGATAPEWVTPSTVAESLGFTAGKNKIINGDFSISQRGTSFTNPGSGAFTADRWSVVWDGSGATRTVSQQVFTAGNAITGYEPRNFLRFNQSVAGTGGSYNLIQNRIEDVRTFAGQTVTVSFWAKADSNITLPQLNWEQGYGTGGSPSSTTDNTFASNVAITTSWVRYTYTVTVPSISGKTVGTTTPGYLGFRIWLPINTAFTFDIWGVQVEAGSVATAFQTATGTLQGELAACQRYYQKSYNQSIAPGTSTASGAYFNMTASTDATPHNVNPRFPVVMRTAPTVTWYSTDGTINRIKNETQGTNLTVTSIFDIGESAAGFPSTSASIDSGQRLRGHYTASAEL